MKVAILHEMLIKFGGAEKVVQTFQKMYPDADLYTLIYDEKKMGDFFPAEKVSTPSITQSLYKITQKQRLCLPFMARAVESLDFSQYDLLICSSSGFAHGAITKPECKFVVYCHAPARYMWDWTNEYQNELGRGRNLLGNLLSLFLSRLFLQLRIWDYIASKRVDITFANSGNTQARITKYHRKDSIILYPPIETVRFQKMLPHNFSFPLDRHNIKKNNYYIIISALTEFKRLDVAIKGFIKVPESNLVIIGKGEQESDLKKLCNSANNIVFVGAQYGDDLVSIVQNSQGLIFPGEEDFGMVPVEALAAGKPVFALAKGGLLETVDAGITGDFFYKSDGSDFIEKFKQFNTNNNNWLYKTGTCISKAEEFDEKNFIKHFKMNIKTS